MQNSKQSPNLYGANVPNHLRNINSMTNPSQLAAQNTQAHGQQQDVSVSPLTSDIMASITQRANQLHQQNLYKANPVPPIHPQQPVS